MRTEVQQLMTRDVRACDPSDSLAAAAIRMWDADCGILPVVSDGRVVGVITDRDICMALALSNTSASERAVDEVSSGRLWSCSPGDDITDALATMARHRVRRLVVVEQGRLAGMLSMNDIVTCAGENAALSQPILAALESISAHRGLPATA